MRGRGNFHKLFLNFLEDTLSEEERREFTEALQSDEGLAVELAQYQQIMKIEREIARQQFDLDDQFTDRVMARLSRRPWYSRGVVMQYLNGLGKYIRNKLNTNAIVLIGVMALIWWFFPPAGGPLSGARGYVGDRIYVVEDHILTTITGTYGALLMVLCFLFSVIFIISKKVKRAGAFLVMTCLMFTSRSVVSTWFNDRPSFQENDLTVYNDGHPTNSRESVAFNKLGITRPPASEVVAAKDGQHVNPFSNYSFFTSQDLVNERNSPKTEAFGGLFEPEESTGERYMQVPPGIPVLTRNEPRSTFSIDVDTGSYTNSRRYIRLGQLPPPQAVRVEEFLNYFDYTYSQSADGSPFATSFEIAPAIDESGKYLLKIGIKAQNGQTGEVEKPWNLVFLIDTSGSMDATDKLPLVKQSLSLLVDKMRTGDTLSIVTYAGTSQILLPPTSIAGKQEILKSIAGLSSGGSTAGAAGILDAYRLAEQTFIRNGVNRVVLATDGDFNVGVSNTDDLVKLIEEKRRTGVTLTTLAIGTGNLNEAMMEQLANKGNGNYFYIDSFSEARKVFEDDLYGTIEVVAKDVKLQIEFNPARVVQYRLIGYDNRVLRNEDFANDKIDAGEIGAGHTVTAMYEIVLAGSKAAASIAPEYRYRQEQATPVVESAQEFQNELAFLQIRYKQPEGTESVVRSYPVLDNMIVQHFEQASIDFCFASAVQAFAARLRDGQSGPGVSYNKIATTARRCKGSDTHGRRQEFIELVENVAAIRGESTPPQ